MDVVSSCRWKLFRQKGWLFEGSADVALVSGWRDGGMIGEQDGQMRARAVNGLVGNGRSGGECCAVWSTSAAVETTCMLVRFTLASWHTCDGLGVFA